MCYTHTLYHTQCGCYSKPQFFDGSPCIRATSQLGLSTHGCWDVVDMGIDSVDTMCSLCASASACDAADTAVASVEAMQPSESTSLSSSGEGEDQKGAHLPGMHNSAQKLLLVIVTDIDPDTNTIPYNTHSKARSTTTTCSRSSPRSRKSSVDNSRDLLRSLPRVIPRVKRSEYGKGLLSTPTLPCPPTTLPTVSTAPPPLPPKKPRPAAWWARFSHLSNLHWRAYDGRGYSPPGGAKSGVAVS